MQIAKILRSHKFKYPFDHQDNQQIGDDDPPMFY